MQTMSNCTVHMNYLSILLTNGDLSLQCLSEWAQWQLKPVIRKCTWHFVIKLLHSATKVQL